jgi:transcriptional regulator with XRE-family HTH domain
VDRNYEVEPAMSIGENLRQKREAMKLSQKALAEMVGSGENTYIGWEKDKNPPPADKLGEIAKILGCSTDELIFERSDRDISSEMRAIFRRFNALPEDMKLPAKIMLRGMVHSLEEEAFQREASTAA